MGEIVCRYFQGHGDYRLGFSAVAAGKYAAEEGRKEDATEGS